LEFTHKVEDHNGETKFELKLTTFFVFRSFICQSIRFLFSNLISAYANHLKFIISLKHTIFAYNNIANGIGHKLYQHFNKNANNK